MRRLILGDRDTFECIGSACPYTCCAYWAVYIDKKTDRYYRSLQGEYGEYLNEHIDRSGKQARMVMVHGRCPQLREDNLCRLYRELGPEHLCETCKVYPRQRTLTGETLFDSLTLSCPEAGRLMFSHQEPLEITEKEFKLEESAKTPFKRESKEDQAFFNFSFKVFQTGMKLLQNRQHPIAARQRTFLLMAKAVQDCIDAEDMKKAKTVLELFSLPERYADLAQRPVTTADPSAKFRFFQSLLFMLMSTEQESIDRMMEVLFHGEHQINWTAPQDTESMLRCLNQMEGEEYQREQEHFLVYCLFRYFWRHADPKDRNLYQRAVFIVSFAQYRRLFESFICARSGQMLDFSQRVLVTSIVARGVEHSDTDRKIERFNQKLKEEHFGELGRMFQIIS